MAKKGKSRRTRAVRKQDPKPDQRSGLQEAEAIPAAPRKSEQKRYLFDALVLAFAILLAFLIYSNSIQGPFIFDDWNNIEVNDAIKLTDLSPGSLWAAGFDSPHPRRFFAYMTFGLNHYFHQEQTAGYHIVNILIHAFTGFLVYQFARATLSLPALRDRYPRHREIALFVAIIWLAHPMAAQSVAYLVQRMNSLATMFYLLSMLCYVYGRQAAQLGRRALWFAACALAGVLALGSKEIAATLPFFILLYEWYFFRDLDPAWLKRNLLPILALIVVVGGAGLVATGGTPLSGFEGRAFTMGERVLTQFRVVIFYLSLLLFPHPSRLTINHDFSISHGIFDPTTTLLSIGAVAGLLALAVYAARKERLLSFCILWFFGQLAIESSVLPLELVFEHRTYLPSIGVFLLGVAWFYRFTNVTRIQFVALGALALLLSFWAHERSHVWSDDIVFWSDDVTKAPKVARLYNNLGVALEEQGRLDEALANYRKGYSLNPGFYRALNNVGLIHLEKREYDEALRAFERSMEIKPDDVDAYKGLALTYQAMKDWAKYREYMKKVSSMEPRDIR